MEDYGATWRDGPSSDCDDGCSCGEEHYVVIKVLQSTSKNTNLDLQVVGSCHCCWWGCILYLEVSQFQSQESPRDGNSRSSRDLSHHRVKDGTTSERRGRKELHACHCVIRVTYSGINDQHGA